MKGKAEKVAIVYDDVPEKTLVSGSLFKLKVTTKYQENIYLLFCYVDMEQCLKIEVKQTY